MRRCILHIGHAKTATSYLQSAMHLNANRLAGAGFWVPADFTPFGDYDCRILAQAGNTFEGNLAPLFRAAEQADKATFDQIISYLFQTDLPHVLLSSELLFYYVDLVNEIIQAAKNAGFSVEVLAYLPRQDHAIISGYLQNVRNHGVGGTVLEFLAATASARYFRYFDVLSIIERLAAPERIIARTFQPNFLRGGAILPDFLAILDPAMNGTDWLQPTPETNSGLTLECYELLRALHQLHREDLVEPLARQPMALSEADRLRVFRYYYTDEVRSVTIQNYLPENSLLLATFLADKSLAEIAFWGGVEDLGPRVQLDSAKMADCLSSLLVRATEAETT